MRFIILFLFAIAIGNAALSQASHKKAASGNRATPSKTEIQSQMNGVTGELKKQVVDLKKQLKETTDPEEKEALQDQINMLEKQLSMMQGLNKNLSAMSDKTIQEGLEEEAAGSDIPKRDVTRISSLPKTILTEAQLALLFKNVHLQIEKMISPLEKKDATDMYNETMAKYNSIAAVANTASACWMTGNPEKALYILGKICMMDLTDADNLNNYAAFLLMSGGEHVAIPILEYLNAKYANNSTVLNNLGQAWYGLGDIDKSKKYLDDALEIYKTHSIANSTISKIYKSKGQTTQAIDAMKLSLKESYDQEKEMELSKLGYEVKLMDLPRVTVPFPEDPFNLTALIKTWDPNKIQSSISDESSVHALQDYIEGIREFKEELDARSLELGKILHQLGERIKDPNFAKEYVRPYNNSLHILAVRCLYLYQVEQNASSKSSFKNILPDLDQHIGGPSNFSENSQVNEQPKDAALDFLSLDHLLRDVEIVWAIEVKEPLAELALTLGWENTDPNAHIKNCKEIDQVMNTYLAKRKEIYNQGVKKIQEYYLKRSAQLRNYILHDLYTGKNYSPEPLNENDLDGMRILLISHLDRTIEKESKANNHYKQILNVLKLSAHIESTYSSACDQMPKPKRKPKAVPLKNHEVKEFPCDFVKKLVDDDRVYIYKYECNAVKEKKDKRLETDKSRGNKGSAFKSRSGNKKAGPAQPRRGPQNDLTEYESHPAPLTAEEKDPSQFYLEYDKHGKLMGLNFQLNKDGTAFADNDPDPSPSETRWTWNAIASAKKGFLNKLIIK